MPKPIHPEHINLLKQIGRWLAPRMVSEKQTAFLAPIEDCLSNLEKQLKLTPDSAFGIEQFTKMIDQVLDFLLLNPEWVNQFQPNLCNSSSLKHKGNLVNTLQFLMIAYALKYYPEHYKEMLEPFLEAHYSPTLVGQTIAAYNAYHSSTKLGYFYYSNQKKEILFAHAPEKIHRHQYFSANDFAARSASLEDLLAKPPEYIEWTRYDRSDYGCKVLMDYSLIDRNKIVDVHLITDFVPKHEKLKSTMDALESQSATSSSSTTNKDVSNQTRIGKTTTNMSSNPISMDLLANQDRFDDSTTHDAPEDTQPTANKSGFFSSIFTLFTSFSGKAHADKSPNKQQNLSPQATSVSSVEASTSNIKPVCQPPSMNAAPAKPVDNVVKKDTYQFNLPRYGKLNENVKEQFEEMQRPDHLGQPRKKFSVLLSNEARNALDSSDGAKNIICCLSETIPDCPVRCKGFIFELDTLLDLLEKGNGTATFPIGNDANIRFTYNSISPAEDVVREIRNQMDEYYRAHPKPTSPKVHTG